MMTQSGRTIKGECEMAYKKMDGSELLLAAHRGDLKHYPENTLPAFQAALDAHMDMIETDVHMTKDGVLILMHDANTLRTTGHSGLISEMTLQEIKNLDAGSWKDARFAGTRVPTVREFLELIRDTDMLVNWELKDYPGDLGDEWAFECVDKLVALIREYGMSERSMMNSFSDRLLEHVRESYGREFVIHGQGIYRARRSKDDPKMDEKDLFDWVCLYPEAAGKLAIDYLENWAYCRENGVLTCILLPDTLENYQKSIELGCRMFTSNDIHAAEKVLKALGER